MARIFNTYGPRMHPTMAASSPTSSSRRCAARTITIYGDGSQTRSFCYVDDLIDGFMRLMAADDDVTGPVNLGNPHEITVHELADLIIRLTGSRSSHRPSAAAAGRPVAALPGHHARPQHAGWEPRVELEEGLRTTINYFAGLMAQPGVFVPALPGVSLQTREQMLPATDVLQVHADRSRKQKRR